MFSQKEFIEASRKFVCVRLESYESEEHQELVRSFLNGRFANTAFCILDPGGKERLTQSSRSPKNVLGAVGRGPHADPGSNEDVIEEMNKIAGEYSRKGDPSEIVLQDFHTFRQALNVASGDQRLLLYVDAPETAQERIHQQLQPVFASDEVIGRFHLDFSGGAADADWEEVIQGSKDGSHFVLIRPDAFGQKGDAVAVLPISTAPADLKRVLLEQNRAFAETEERKVYSEHVQNGRREGIHFETGMPYGEDRDGDGEIDRRGGKGKGKGKGRKGPREG